MYISYKQITDFYALKSIKVCPLFTNKYCKFATDKQFKKNLSKTFKHKQE